MFVDRSPRIASVAVLWQNRRLRFHQAQQCRAAQNDSVEVAMDGTPVIGSSQKGPKKVSTEVSNTHW